MPAEPSIAFSVREQDDPAIEVLVNFGVFAGRDVTAAEIDDLARKLASIVDEFSVVAEQRHEFAASVEASLHLVRIEVARESAGGDSDTDALCDQIVAAAETWAEACVADRHMI